MLSARAFRISSLKHETRWNSFALPSRPVVEMKTSSAAPIASAKHFNLEAIVVSKEDIDEKIARIANLTKDMSELRSDTEYSLHVKDA